MKNELMEIFRGFRLFEYALWQKTKTRTWRKLTELLGNKKTPIVNGFSLLENCYKATNFISKHHFGFHNKKSHFQASMVCSFWWSWATRWELCPEHTKCLESTRFNELTKILWGFRVFRYALWQKTKTWKRRKSTESFLTESTYC